MIASVIIGNVGSQPERSEDGKRTRLRVASNHGWKDNATVTWVSVTLWGKTAEWVAANIAKGDKVCVVGKVYAEDYQGKVYIKCDADSLDRLSQAGDKPKAEESIPF